MRRKPRNASRSSCFHSQALTSMLLLSTSTGNQVHLGVTTCTSTTVLKRKQICNATFAVHGFRNYCLNARDSLGRLRVNPSLPLHSLYIFPNEIIDRVYRKMPYFAIQKTI